MRCVFLLELCLEEMALCLYRFILTLLLCGEGLCQCFSQLDCGGDVLPSENQRDCCVSQNGLTYKNGGTCTPCIGNTLIACLIHNRDSVILQFMVSKMLCMMLMRMLNWRLSLP